MVTARLCINNDLWESCSLDFTAKDLEGVKTKMMSACKKFKADGWWHPISNPKAVKIALVKEMGGAFFKNMLSKQKSA